MSLFRITPRLFLVLGMVALVAVVWVVTGNGASETVDSGNGIGLVLSRQQSAVQRSVESFGSTLPLERVEVGPSSSPHDVAADDSGTVLDGAAIVQPADVSATVTVLTPAGDPAEGARVVLRACFSAAPRALSSPGKAVDGHGVASFEVVPSGCFYALAVLEGFAETASKPIQVSPSISELQVAIRLKAGGTVSGSLNDIYKRPASGVTMRLHSEPRSHDGQAVDTEFFRQATVTESGSFEFSHVPAGGYTLRSAAGENDRMRVPDQFLSIDVRENETTYVSFEDISETYVLVSCAVLEDGVPMAGARVDIVNADRSDTGFGRWVQTDDEGTFRVTLDQPGDYRFQISRSGALGGSVFHVERIPFERTYGFEILIDTGSMAGRVVDARGEPAKGVRVIAVGTPFEPGGDSFLIETVTSEGGDFHFHSAIPGSYTILAGASALLSGDRSTNAAGRYLGGAELVGVQVLAGDSVTALHLQLSEAAAVMGVVVDASGGPVHRARVECWPTLAEFQGFPSETYFLNAPHSTSDANGTFSVGALPGGEYRVRAVLGNRISSWRNVELEPGFSAPVDLRLAQGAVMDVSLKTSSDPDVRVYVRVHDNAGMLLSASITEAGRAKFGPLLAGRYQIKAMTLDGKSEASRLITVQAGQELTVLLELD